MGREAFQGQAWWEIAVGWVRREGGRYVGRVAGGGGGWEVDRPQIRKGQGTNMLAVGSQRRLLCSSGEVILVAGKEDAQCWL